MSKQISITSAITFIPASSGAGQYAFTTTGGTASGITNAYTNADSTTAARLTVPTTASRTYEAYFNYNMDALSGIPSDAIINSVSGRVKYYFSNTNTNRLSAVTIQLYTNTTAKGTAVTARTGTAASIQNINGGSWTRSELQNARLYVSVRRGTNTNSLYMYLYGTDMTVNYTVNEIAYEVNVTNNSTLATVSPTYASGMTGEDFTISFDDIVDKSEIVVKDNNVDVTNSLVAGGGGFQYTISNISADHTIVVTDGNVTKYTVNASSSYAGATVSPATQQVIEGRSATVYVEVDNLYEIVAKDNGTVIQLPEPVEDASENFIPSAYVQSASTATTGTSYPTSNGLANTGSTTYAAFTAQTGANAIVEAVYSFNCSSIPQGAVIDRVTCAINCRTSSATYLPTSHAQLYHGSTPKGSQSANINATQSTRTFDGGSWTREELEDISLHYVGQRGTSNTTSTASLRLYGANLLVEYHVPCSYTISNVQTSHTITIEEAPYYTISTASTYAGATASVSPAHIYAGLDATITVSVQNLYEVKIKLDNVDVTSNFVGSNGTYTYTLTNVQASHSLSIEEAPYSTISVSSTYAGATGSANPTKVYSGRSTTITVSVANLYEVVIKDNNVDVTSQFTGSNGTYTRTINNVNANHSLSIEEAPYYNVTVNNSYQDATVTVDPPKGYYGIDVDVRIQVSNIDEIKVMDNGVSVMANIINVGSGLYRYTINAINADHTITIIESTRYNITASSNYSAVSISPASASVIEGHSQTFVIEGDEDTDLGADIILLDNNVDVTSQMTRAMGETGTTSTVLGTFDSENSDYVGIYNNYEYTRAEGQSCANGVGTGSGNTRSSFYPATGTGSELIVFYNFSGITVPEGATITNVSAKAAVAPAYNGAGYTEMSLQLCIGTNPVGEATPISTASTNANEHTIDGGSGWTANDLANAKIKMYGVRNNTNSNNDDTGKRDNLNMCGADLIVTYSLPGGYLYTISNIQTAHTLVINEVPATYYTVTASSSYLDATITPATQSIRHNHTAKLQISAASIYDIVVKDNGVNVTSELVQNETGFTYTIQKITAPHTITVEESESFAITTSSQYQDATISPATQSVRQGMSAVTYVEVGSPDEIAVLDNNIDVTGQLVLTTPGESYTASGILSTFDTVNSDYVGIYSSYAATNAEGKSSADGIANTGATRSAFYPATGAGSELYIYYDFGDVQGIPSDAVIYNVSANVAFSTAYSGQGYSDVTLQLCIGTTPVGEATHPEIGADVAPATARTATVDGGSGWTLNDITNAKILLYGVRNDTNSNNDANGTRDNLCMHGADIIVTYGDGNTFNGYTYTLNNIQTAHTIVIIENPQYTLTSASYVQDVTITPATTTVYGRQDVTFHISGDLGEAVVLDNNIDVTTQLRTNATGRTYTITNVQSAHTVTVTEPSQESDLIKVGGTYKKVIGFYKKINGNWVLIEKSAFDTQVSSNIVMYGGVIESVVIGDVETSGGSINISINDGSLDSGSYKMVYEDVNRTPITGYTNINEFTIQ